MTNKPLFLLGVVAALALAGREANAQEPCVEVPALGPTVGSVEANHEFSCLLGNMTFSDFSFAGVPTTARLLFVGESNPAPHFVNVILSQGSAAPLTGTPKWDFTVTTTPGDVITLAGNGLSFSPPVDIKVLTTMNQTSFSICIPDQSACPPGPNPGAIVPPARIVTVTNSATIIPGSNGGATPPGVGGLSNGFSSGPAVVTPEPTSFVLFGLGLAGLALARRRRS
jgi:hypothetical protein